MLVAFFLAAVLQPVMRVLSRFLSKPLALVVVLLLLGTVMFAASLLFFANVQAISAKAPEYTQRFESMTASALQWAQANGIPIQLKQLGTQKALSWVLQYTTYGLTSFFTLIGELVLVLFILIFLTLEVDAFEEKFGMAFGNRAGSEVLETLTSITERIQQYAITKTFVSLLTGVCTWAIAKSFGIDFAFFWGLLAFLLNYIPNIGSIIAILPPVVLAFLQFGGWQEGVGVLTGLTATQLILGNIVEPRIMGQSMNLSPLVVFLSMVFWGWMWGVVGMVMAVPLTVGLKIICEHIESLHPIAIVLGDYHGSKDTAQRLGLDELVHRLVHHAKEEEEKEQAQTKQTKQTKKKQKKKQA
jgi:predicted PurR-regulated permease PerM